jgi:hypothetical protein
MAEVGPEITRTQSLFDSWPGVFVPPCGKLPPALPYLAGVFLARGYSKLPGGVRVC